MCSSDPSVAQAIETLVSSENMRFSVRNVLGGMKAAIGRGHLEQPFQQVDQNRIAGLEHGRDLLGILVEPGHILPRQVKDARSIAFFLWLDGEHPAKSRDLCARDLPVSLGQLCTKREFTRGWFRSRTDCVNGRMCATDIETTATSDSAHCAMAFRID